VTSGSSIHRRHGTRQGRQGHLIPIRHEAAGRYQQLAIETAAGWRAIRRLASGNELHDGFRRSRLILQATKVYVYEPSEDASFGVVCAKSLLLTSMGCA